MDTFHYGFGLEISVDKIRMAAAGPDHELINKEMPLPLLFIPESGMRRPFGIRDWLSDIKVPQQNTNGAVEHVNAPLVLSRSIETLIGQMRADLHDPIESVLIAVPHVLSEKERFLLRTIVREIVQDVQFINEDSAMMAADLERDGQGALFIFNLRPDNVEISFYEKKEGVLKQVELEVFEKSGYNSIDCRLIQALANASDIDLPWRQMEDLYKSVSQSRGKWRPPSPFTVATENLPKGFKSSITSDAALNIIEDVLSPAYSAVQKIISSTKQPIKTILLSRLPVTTSIIRRFRENSGGEILLQGRDKILDGAAMHARLLRGRKQNAPKEKMSGVDNGNGEEPPQEMSAPRETKDDARKQKVLPSSETVAPVIGDIQHVVDKIAEALEKYNLEEIVRMVPGLLRVSEEMGAKVLNVWAKKLSDAHKFEEAYDIYNKHWRKNSGYDYLSGPAAGLCLAQARIALHNGQLKKARKWSARGLSFNPKNDEWIRTLQAIHRRTKRQK